jgi:hypothetical protein
MVGRPLVDDIPLVSTTAVKARSEISFRWPDLDVTYTGYDEDGEAVIMSMVRKKGSTANVATAMRNRAKKSVRFVAHVPYICTCTFVASGVPMNSNNCHIHMGRAYGCDVCECTDYKPRSAPRDTFWSICTCGHVAQDHNA